MLFGAGTTETLRRLSEGDFLSVFEGVPRTISAAVIEAGVPVIISWPENRAFPSKGEARRIIQQGGLSVNKEKLTDQNALIGREQVLNGKNVLSERGKKSYSACGSCSYRAVIASSLVRPPPSVPAQQALTKVTKNSIMKGKNAWSTGRTITAPAHSSPCRNKKTTRDKGTPWPPRRPKWR